MLQTSGNSSTSEPVHSTEETIADETSARLVDSNSIFSVDQEQLFQKHFEEGYDLFPDPDYVRWLTLHHPEFCDRAESQSLADQFSDVHLEEPVAIIEQTSTSIYSTANVSCTPTLLASPSSVIEFTSTVTVP